MKLHILQFNTNSKVPCLFMAVTLITVRQQLTSLKTLAPVILQEYVKLLKQFVHTKDTVQSEHLCVWTAV